MAVETYGQRLGGLILRKRRVMGLSQLQLSEDAFGSSAKTRRISEIENGLVSNPHPKTIDPIIAVLKITEAELDECAREEGQESDHNLNQAYREARNLLDALAYKFEHSHPDASFAELDSFLREKAEEWRELSARLESIEAIDVEISVEKAKAREALASGELDQVDLILAQLEERFQEERTLMEVTKQAEIRVTRAETCLMNEDLAGATAHYLQAARFFEPFSESEAVRLLDENAHRIYEGSLRTLRPRFEIGIRLLEETLRFSTVMIDPFRRAQADYQLSLFYRNAGIRMASGTKNEFIDRAIAHARSADEYATTANEPYQIACSKVNLANCLLDKGRICKSPKDLFDSIEVLRSAKAISIEEEKANQLLPHICNSLGSVLLAASEAADGPSATEAISDAMEQFSLAVKSSEDHCNIGVWGAAKFNLGRIFFPFIPLIHVRSCAIKMA